MDVIEKLTAQLESERIAKLVAEQVAIRERDRADKMSEALKQIPILQQQIAELKKYIQDNHHMFLCHGHGGVDNLIIGDKLVAQHKARYVWEPHHGRGYLIY